MRRGEGIVHAKFGIIADERAMPLFSVAAGMNQPKDFAAITSGLKFPLPGKTGNATANIRRNFTPSGMTLIPMSIRLPYRRLSPADSSNLPKRTADYRAFQRLARQKAAMIWRFIVESPYLRRGPLPAMQQLWLISGLISAGSLKRPPRHGLKDAFSVMRSAWARPLKQSWS